MYVRVQIEQGVDPDALAVPQQAVRHNDTGGSEVLVVREDNRDDKLGSGSAAP
jgi:membrane fusion protein (multidrug efflux system)